MTPQKPPFDGVLLPQDRRAIKAWLLEIWGTVMSAAQRLDYLDISLDRQLEDLSDDLNIVVENVQKLNERILLLRHR